MELHSVKNLGVTTILIDLIYRFKMAAVQQTFFEIFLQLQKLYPICHTF